MSRAPNLQRATARALAAEWRGRGIFCAKEVGRDSLVRSAGLVGVEWVLQRMRTEGGGLSEWLSHEGSGVATVVLGVLRAASCQGRGIVLVEGAQPLFPPAWGALGIDAHPAAWIRPGSDQERYWAIEQALRCKGVGGVMAWVDRIPERSMRRLQLAAEQGGGQGFLIRPVEARREKCWGDVRFLVHPRPSEKSDLRDGRRRLEIEVLAGRGGIAAAGESALAEICDATGAVRLVSPVADPTALRRPARA
ncbi:MAG: hypothetical protein IT428_25740 [Planctomycetaceae bacterium]|nr:hypothetical protein [Planctomycetaceae bacterium]